MIVIKDPLPYIGEAELAAEAPPAYEDGDFDQWAAATSEAYAHLQETKAGPPTARPFGRILRTFASTPRTSPVSTPSSPSPSTPISPTLSSTLSSLQSKKPGARSSTWFARTFGSSSRTAKEVKESVTGLLREIVKQPETTASVLIIDSCAEACRTHNLSLPSILQEPSLEGRSTIYWAVIKHPLQPPSPHERDLISTLLDLAAPLTEATISEIRLACLQNSNQPLFQWLRQMPVFSPLNGKDEILLGSSTPRDEIAVENVPGDEGAFIVRFRVMLFQKRMRVSKQVKLEFIARGRMWSLKFLIVTDGDKRLSHRRERPGTWAVTLALVEHSPPTWIDSRLIIEEAPSTSPESASTSQSLVDVVRPFSPSKGGEARANSKPTISLRLKSGSSQLAPAGPNYPNDMIVASLGESLMANSLQYDGSSYIGSDESLQARLEARLGKPDAQCIIC
ncbi:hypothetical protein SCP_0305380 [Sparassis crispa]|uniref:Uncharacterized protein n=1 Tax=Sparassis crispa TaxID=139825 RepID=A0A401GF65_9APHY|nr:hypothetical protein SCP_0305380 [Sparassis crispa]GBE80818.1 hypothetical protein SCP_0305380 [Sparassis crispa]